MDAQEIFNTVAKHLITQGKPARGTNENASCYYRRDGLMCAVGVLIPNGVYTSEMEHRDVSELLIDFPDTLGPILAANEDLLMQLQNVHDQHSLMNEDRTFNIPALKIALAGVARDYHLNAEALSS
jgi:hypothetical protein